MAKLNLFNHIGNSFYEQMVWVKLPFTPLCKQITCVGLCIILEGIGI